MAKTSDLNFSVPVFKLVLGSVRDRTDKPRLQLSWEETFKLLSLVESTLELRTDPGTLVEFNLHS